MLCLLSKSTNCWYYDNNCYEKSFYTAINVSSYLLWRKIIFTRRKSKANVYKFSKLMPFDMLLIEKLFEIKTKRKFTSSSSYCISHVSTNWYVSINFISPCWNVKSSWSNFILWRFMFMNTLLEFLWIAWIDIIFWHFDVMHYHVYHEMEMSSY